MRRGPPTAVDALVERDRRVAVVLLGLLVAPCAVEHGRQLLQSSKRRGVRVAAAAPVAGHYGDRRGTRRAG